jgi:iron complex outermembrane receptor protein
MKIRTKATAALVLWMLFESYAQQKPVDLTELPLEELMNIKVTLGARKSEKISETAAAVYVITQEDLLRSGATSIAEALRMVPGFAVAKVDANKWAITSRGFINVFANKLLVLIDGRSVYSPAFSGVMWESQDLVLDDIDRIEVIRGPGAALWGSNAVNGIINIITKKAQDTRGVLVKDGAGSEEKTVLNARVGGDIGPRIHYRFYTKYFDRDASKYKDGGRAADGWNVMRGGFRMDGDLDADSRFTLQGDVYGGDVGQTLYLPDLHVRLFSYKTDIYGGNVLGRYEHSFSEASDVRLQMYYDRVQRDENVLLGGGYRTFDVDFQHRFRANGRHEIIWGGGYRVTRDRLIPSPAITFVPIARTTGLINAFFQDEIAFRGDRCRLTVGSKFERNDYTGLEIQPNVRMLYKLSESTSAWWAVSRALRTPSRADQDIRVADVMIGSSRFKSEELTAYEAGFHHQPNGRWLLDCSFFYNDYRKLQTFELDTVSNKKSCLTYGAEIVAGWNPAHWWRLRAVYSYIHMRAYPDPDSKDARAFNIQNDNPDQIANVRSSMDLPAGVGLDASLRFMAGMPSPSIDIGKYTELDLRLLWKPGNGNFEFAVVGQNLLESRHQEFQGWWIPFEATQVQRSVYATLGWTFKSF